MPAKRMPSPSHTALARMGHVARMEKARDTAPPASVAMRLDAAARARREREQSSTVSGQRRSSSRSPSASASRDAHMSDEPVGSRDESATPAGILKHPGSRSRSPESRVKFSDGLEASGDFRSASETPKTGGPREVYGARSGHPTGVHNSSVARRGESSAAAHRFPAKDSTDWSSSGSRLGRAAEAEDPWGGCSLEEALGGSRESPRPAAEHSDAYSHMSLRQRRAREAADSWGGSLEEVLAGSKDSPRQPLKSTAHQSEVHRHTGGSRQRKARDAAESWGGSSLEDVLGGSRGSPGQEKKEQRASGAREKRAHDAEEESWGGSLRGPDRSPASRSSTPGRSGQSRLGVKKPAGAAQASRSSNPGQTGESLPKGKKRAEPQRRVPGNRRPDNSEIITAAEEQQLLEKSLEVFRRFDTNGSGAIEREELADILQILNPHLFLESEDGTSPTLQCFFDALDQDGSGFIDFEEFIRWVMGVDDPVAMVDTLASSDLQRARLPEAFYKELDCEVAAEEGFYVEELDAGMAEEQRLARMDHFAEMEMGLHEEAEPAPAEEGEEFTEEGLEPCNFAGRASGTYENEGTHGTYEGDFIFDESCSTPYHFISDNGRRVMNVWEPCEEAYDYGWGCTLLKPPLTADIKTAKVTLKVHVQTPGWGSNGCYLGITPADHDIIGGRAACGESSTFVYRCRDGDKRIGGNWIRGFNSRGRPYQEGEEITLEYRRDERALYVYDASGLCGGGPLTTDLPTGKLFFFFADTCSTNQGWTIVSGSAVDGGSQEVSKLQMLLQQVRAEKLAAAEAEDFDAAKFAKQKEAALLAELSSLQEEAAAAAEEQKCKEKAASVQQFCGKYEIVKGWGQGEAVWRIEQDGASLKITRMPGGQCSPGTGIVKGNVVECQFPNVSSTLSAHFEGNEGDFIWSDGEHWKRIGGKTEAAAEKAAAEKAEAEEMEVSEEVQVAREEKPKRCMEESEEALLAELSSIQSLMESTSVCQEKKPTPIGCAYGGPIRNDQFSESSNYGNNDTFLNLGRARLNCPHGSWAPNPGKKGSREEWLQVDLGENHFISGVQTQGSHGWNEMTTEYEVLVREDASEEWRQAIASKSGSKTFAGNSDQDSIVENTFKEPLYGRFVRFVVKSCGSYLEPCLRVEVLVQHDNDDHNINKSTSVCQGKKPTPIGCAYGGPIRNDQFSESSNYGNKDTFLNLGRARLNCPHGGWAPNPGKKGSREEWLQVDLGENHFISGVQTQGSHGWNEMTTEYEVLVREDASEEWRQAIASKSGSKTFAGNSDQDSIVENTFKEPLYGRFVRFVVKSWGSYLEPCLRVEVLVQQ